jgi:hypothetical protein
MKTTPIKFTSEQAAEIAYKLDILAMEPDLVESCELTNEEACKLAALFIGGKAGTYNVPDKFASVIAEELENSAEIALDNLLDGDTESGLQVYIKSMRQAIKKLEK